MVAVVGIRISRCGIEADVESIKLRIERLNSADWNNDDSIFRSLPRLGQSRLKVGVVSVQNQL